jgi:hypothetical protein
LQNNTKIKILLAYHNLSNNIVLKNNIITPIHVGREIAKPEITAILSKKMIGDDTGDNISKKNHMYCELTAFYWAWKNLDKLDNPDYIGFAHYRRFFNFSNSRLTRLKYLFLHLFPWMKNQKYLTLMQEKDIENSLKDVDILTISKLGLGNIKNLEDFYITHKIDTNGEQIKLAKNIISEEFKDYENAFNEIFYNTHYLSFGNIFVMKKEIFMEYCNFVFGVLKHFDDKNVIPRFHGFLAEGLTNVFIKKYENDGYIVKEQKRKLVNELHKK